MFLFMLVIYINASVWWPAFIETEGGQRPFLAVLPGLSECFALYMAITKRFMEMTRASSKEPFFFARGRSHLPLEQLFHDSAFTN